MKITDEKNGTEVSHFFIRPNDASETPHLTYYNAQIYIDGARLHGVRQVTFEASANKAVEMVIRLIPGSIEVQDAPINFVNDDSGEAIAP